MQDFTSDQLSDAVNTVTVVMDAKDDGGDFFFFLATCFRTFLAHFVILHSRVRAVLRHFNLLTGSNQGHKFHKTMAKLASSLLKNSTCFSVELCVGFDAPVSNGR